MQTRLEQLLSLKLEKKCFKKVSLTPAGKSPYNFHDNIFRSGLPMAAS